MASRYWRKTTAISVITNGALALAAVLGLAGLTFILDRQDDVRKWLLGYDARGIATVAQVVPATVVAVFVFALGAVFVIAQIVIPSRGARSASVLLRYVRTRLVLAAGVVLLVGSLLVTTGAQVSLDQWRASLAAALLVASSLYILLATAFLAWTLAGQISPRLFRDRLVQRPRRWWGLAPWRHRSWDPESLFWTLRVFRGWIRTVNRIGESRDLHFALDGLLVLVKDYVGQARTDEPLRRSRPEDYSPAKESEISNVSDRLFLASDCGEDPAKQLERKIAEGLVSDLDDYWFASELGRALTRAVESGVRGNTLRRDLDRLLNLFDRALFEMAPRLEQSKDAVLISETRTMVKQLIEVGLGVRQSDEAQRDWYAAPALRLARQVSYLCVVAKERAVRGECSAEWQHPCSLPQWALAGWMMVTEAYLAQRSTSDVAGRDEAQDETFVRQSVKWFSLLQPSDLVAAANIAKSRLLQPAWDVIVDQDARIQRIHKIARLTEEQLWDPAASSSHASTSDSPGWSVGSQTGCTAAQTSSRWRGRLRQVIRRKSFQMNDWCRLHNGVGED